MWGDTWRIVWLLIAGVDPWTQGMALISSGVGTARFDSNTSSDDESYVAGRHVALGSPTPHDTSS